MPGTGQGCKTRWLLRWELGVTPVAVPGPVARGLTPSVSRDVAGYKASPAKGALEPGDNKLKAHQRSCAA